MTVRMCVCVCVCDDSMMGQLQTVSPPVGRHLNLSSSPDQHQQLAAADIVSMLKGLSAEQQHEFYQATATD